MTLKIEKKLVNLIQMIYISKQLQIQNEIDCDRLRISKQSDVALPTSFAEQGDLYSVTVFITAIFLSFDQLSGKHAKPQRADSNLNQR